MGGGFAFAPTFAPSQAANYSSNIAWDQTPWDPFGNGGLNAAGPAGFPMWMWLAAGVGIYLFMRR